MKGFWIEVEGPDGSGKGTQTELLADTLRQRGHQVTTTHEPWEGAPRGRLIRDVLQHKITELPSSFGSIDPTTFQWQYVVNRATEHYPEVIEPALAKGEILISDRGRVSTHAYGSAFGVSDEMIDEWHRLVIPMRPNLILYLATSPETCMKRLDKAERKGEPEYFERADKIARIVHHYGIVLERYYSDIAVAIDNERGVSKVQQYILDAVLLRLEGR